MNRLSTRYILMHEETMLWILTLKNKLFQKKMEKKMGLGERWGTFVGFWGWGSNHLVVLSKMHGHPWETCSVPKSIKNEFYFYGSNWDP